MDTDRNRPTPPTGKLSADARLTLLLQGLFTFAYVMSGTFLNLYLWRLTEDLWVNGFYNFIVFISTAVSFLISGGFAKRFGKMPVFRIGIGLYTVFYLFVVAAGTQVVTYYELFAVFFGIASGLYWIGFWTLTYEVSNDGNRLRFIGLNSVVSTAANLTAPLVSAGIFLVMPGLHGYLVIFALAFLFYLATALISHRIRHKVPSAREKRYYIRHMTIVFRRNKAWRKAVFGNLLFGARQGVQLLLPVLLLYQTFGEEDRIGLLNAVLSFFSILASYLFSRFAREAHIRTCLACGAVLTTAGASLLMTGLSPVTVVGFMLAGAIGNPVIQSSLDGYNYKLIGGLPLRGEMRIEALVLREVCWNIGRACAVMLMVLIADDLSGFRLSAVVVFIMAAQLLLAVFVEKPARSTKEPAASAAG